MTAAVSSLTITQVGLGLVMVVTHTSARSHKIEFMPYPSPLSRKQSQNGHANSHGGDSPTSQELPIR